MPRKSATWETALLPPQGRHAVDFFRPKNPTASAGIEPAIREGCNVETLNMFKERQLVYLSDSSHSTGNRRIHEQHSTTVPPVYFR